MRIPLRGRRSTGTRTTTWQCYACLTKNDAHATNCEACGARKINA